MFDVILRFENPETMPTAIELGPLPHRDVPSIMDWYGAYYAGDDYQVFINGTQIPIGINGEYQFPQIDGSVEEFEPAVFLASARANPVK